jgi:carbonic anhydrase
MPTERIFKGVQRSRARFQADRDALARPVAEAQAPQVLFIACSDSRVSPELLTSAERGDLFVLRTLANLVPPYGTGEVGPAAVVEYAVLHLHVGHLVLCGHTDCGGIKALDSPADWSREPHIARWLEQARWAQTRVQARGVPDAERHLAIVRENVLLQIEHLRSYDVVRECEQAGTLALHGWVYRLETGAIESFEAETNSWTELASM